MKQWLWNRHKHDEHHDEHFKTKCTKYTLHNHRQRKSTENYATYTMWLRGHYTSHPQTSMFRAPSQNHQHPPEKQHIHLTVNRPRGPKTTSQLRRAKQFLSYRSKQHFDCSDPQLNNRPAHQNPNAIPESPEHFTTRCTCHSSGRCWLFRDRAQNTPIWGRRCSTPSRNLNSKLTMNIECTGIPWITEINAQQNRCKKSQQNILKTQGTNCG